MSHQQEKKTTSDMDKSTPISHLRRDDEDGGNQGDMRDDAAAMMDHMVDDIEGEDGSRGMPGQPMPGYHHEEFDPRMMQQQQQPGYGGSGNGVPPPPGYGNPHQYGGGGPNRGMGGPPGGMRGEMPGLENASFTQKLMAEAKEPLLVAVLVIMLSSNQVGGLIARFLPIADKNPLVGLMVRAGIAGIAFWLLRRFIPSAN